MPETKQALDMLYTFNHYLEILRVASDPNLAWGEELLIERIDRARVAQVERK